MNFKIVFIFLSYLHAEFLENDVLLDSLGIYVSRTEQMDFADNMMSIFMTRTYRPHLCNEQILLGISKNLDCQDKRKQNALEEVAKAISQECNAIWDAELDKLRSTIPKEKTSRDSKRSTDNVKVANSTPNEQTFAQMMAYDAVATTIRRKRSLTSLLGTLSNFNGIAKTLVTSFSLLYTFFTHTQLKNRINLLKVETIQTQHRQALATASLMDHIVSDIDVLSDNLCDNDVLTSARIRELNSNMVLHQILAATEKEILAFSFNQVPHSVDFLKQLIDLCTRIETNDENFCRRMVYSSKYTLDFDGTVIRDRSLVALVRISMPVRSVSFKNNLGLRILNIGDFDRKQYYNLDVPNYAIQLPTGVIYEINAGACNDGLCHLNNIVLSNRARCLDSLLQNSTEHCLKIFTDSPPSCLFYRVLSGWLIMAPRSIFIPDDIEQEQSVKLQRKLYLIKKGGRLLCQSGGLNSTHFLTTPEIKIENNSSLKTKRKLEIIHRVNLTLLKSERDFDSSIRAEIEKLKESDDRLEINGKEFPIFTVCVSISLISTSLLVCIYATFVNRVSIFNTILRIVLKRKSIDGPKQNEVELESLGAGGQTEEETKLEEEIELVNGSRSALYPTLVVNLNKQD